MVRRFKGGKIIKATANVMREECGYRVYEVITENNRECFISHKIDTRFRRVRIDFDPMVLMSEDGVDFIEGCERELNKGAKLTGNKKYHQFGKC
jgi:hypothetical protein